MPASWRTDRTRACTNRALCTKPCTIVSVRRPENHRRRRENAPARRSSLAARPRARTSESHMAQIEWLNDSELRIADVSFYCSLDDFSRKTDKDRFVLLKDRSSLEQYASVFAEAPPRTMLEFGIFQGGSSALFSLWF